MDTVPANGEGLFEIRADTVTLELVDIATNTLVRRTLPLSYYENAHCLRLQGEDFKGKASEIVFFSQQGVDKMRDMTGGGPDRDPCGGHSGT